MEWFKVKFLAQTPESIKKFLKINNLTYIPISNEEKNGIRNELVMSTIGEYNVLLIRTLVVPKNSDKGTFHLLVLGHIYFFHVASAFSCSSFIGIYDADIPFESG